MSTPPLPPNTVAASCPFHQVFDYVGRLDKPVILQREEDLSSKFHSVYLGKCPICERQILLRVRHENQKA